MSLIEKTNFQVIFHLKSDKSDSQQHHLALRRVNNEIYI